MLTVIPSRPNLYSISSYTDWHSHALQLLLINIHSLGDTKHYSKVVKVVYVERVTGKRV